MCDYSLMGMPNRLAKEDEDLVLYRFHTGTLGFTSLIESSECQQSSSLWQRLKKSAFVPEASISAVCVPPGARLRLEGVPKGLQVQLQVGKTEEVTFTQVGAEPNRHRDAVRFNNGKVSKLQHLRPGMRAKVLGLSLSDDTRGIDDSLEFRGFTVGTGRAVL